MNRLLILVLALPAVLICSPARADTGCVIQSNAGTVNGGITVHVQVCTPSSESNETVDTNPIRDSDLDSVCVATAIGAGIDPFEFCDLPLEDAEDFVTPGLVATAFQQLPLPPSKLNVQPANGRTLVNFETNFFTETAPFDRTVTLLGQRVDLHIVPSEFGWRFGDGAAVATSDAGAPYPDLRITHDYERKGRVRPAVDTTYTATYRVNGGPWAAVPGSVTIAGSPVGLEVLSATPVLVGS